jgi:hypothetical protein
MEFPPRKRLQLTPPPDRDMDSNLSENEMFPDEALNNPATPHNNTLTNVAANELSPPNSQSHARDPAITSLGVNSNGKRPLSTGMAHNTEGQGVAGGGHQDAETGYQWTKQEDQPGFEWKNNRAREEENRALDTIIDKGHMIRREHSLSLAEGV